MVLQFQKNLVIFGQNSPAKTAISAISSSNAGDCFRKTEVICCKKSDDGLNSYKETKTVVECNCNKGYLAGRVNHQPACVEASYIINQNYCGMQPCADNEFCKLTSKTDEKPGWICQRYYDPITEKKVDLIGFKKGEMKRLVVVENKYTVND